MILNYLLYFYPRPIDITVLFPLASAFNFALMPYDNKYFLLLEFSQSNDDIAMIYVSWILVSLSHAMSSDYPGRPSVSWQAAEPNRISIKSIYIDS